MILRSVFSNWAGLVVMGLISVVLTPILIHGLGDFHYGMWILVASLVDYYGLLDMGMRVTLQRFVARYKGTNEREALNSVFATALALTLGVCLFICVLTVALAILLPDFFRLEAEAHITFRWLVLLLGLSVGLTLPARLLGTYLCGLQRFDLHNLGALLTSSLRAVLLVGALERGYGVLGVAWVTLGMTLLSLPLHWALVQWVDRRLKLDWRQVSWQRIRELIHFSFYIFLNTTGDRLRSYTDSIVIARLLGMALITPFSVATRLMEYFKQVLFALVGPLMPAMSELDGLGRLDDLRRFFLRATRVSGLFSFGIGLVLLFDGRALLRLWVGESFVSSYPFLAVLTVGYVASLAQAPSSILLVARGRHRPLGWWTLVEGVVNLGLSIYWATKYGLLGVALGTMVPMLAVKLLIQPWYVLRALDLSLRHYVAGALARPLGVAVLFFLLWQGVAPLVPGSGPLTFLGTVACQAALFGLLSYWVGFSAPEREALWERGRRLAAGLPLAGVNERVG